MAHGINPHSARRLFQELTNAEMAYLAKGTPHEEFLARRRHLYRGQTLRELDRILALGAQTGVFVRYFLDEFEGCY